MQLDLPRCTSADGVRTSKRLAVKQTIRFCIEAIPRVKSGFVALEVNTVCAVPDGAIGRIVAALHLEGYVKMQFDKMLQKMLSRYQLKYIFPPDFERYAVQITHVGFYDQGGGRLGMTFSGSGRLTPDNTVELIERFLSR